MHPRHQEGHLFLSRPLLGPLLFDNELSEARDHCACERSLSSFLILFYLFHAVLPSPHHRPILLRITCTDISPTLPCLLGSLLIAFLSWLRLSIYMTVVACAIVISFHIRNPPTKLERHMAIPLGLVFWVSALACLLSGFANYIKAVTKYSRREALVQSGWKTQSVRVLLHNSKHQSSAMTAVCEWR